MGLSHGGGIDGGEGCWLTAQPFQKQEDREFRSHSLQRWDTYDPGILDRLPSAPLTGQELDLVVWGHVAHPSLLGSKVDVLRGHGASHREVLEDGGEEEE